MGGKKKLTKASTALARSAVGSASRGRTHASGASFPVAPPRSELPVGYAEMLGEIKLRIQQERLRVVLAANAAMVMLYWDIGRMILDRQERAGWGAKVIDRLAADLRNAFPDMKGFSPRNLRYMRAFAAAWPERPIVQEALAQIPWYHHIALLEKLDDPIARRWYARQAMEHGWSHNIMVLQIHGRERRSVRRRVKHYNLDAIISVGYRINSHRGVRFRQWATTTLREHLVRGYTLNRQRFQQNAAELETTLALVRRGAGSSMSSRCTSPARPSQTLCAVFSRPRGTARLPWSNTSPIATYATPSRRRCSAAGRGWHRSIHPPRGVALHTRCVDQGRRHSDRLRGEFHATRDTSTSRSRCARWRRSAPTFSPSKGRLRDCWMDY